MAINNFHDEIEVGNIHRVTNGTYADATERLAESLFTSVHVDKVYRQLDDNSYWVVLDVIEGVPTWGVFSGAGYTGIIQTYVYANAAAREGESGFTSGDIDKWAKQTDDKSLWRCTDVIEGVPLWEALHSQVKTIKLIRSGVGGALVLTTDGAAPTSSNQFKLLNADFVIFTGILAGHVATSGDLIYASFKGAAFMDTLGSSEIVIESSLDAPSESLDITFTSDPDDIYNGCLTITVNLAITSYDCVAKLDYESISLI